MQKDDLKNFLQKEYVKKFDCRLRFLIDKYTVEAIVKSIVQWLREGNVNYCDATTFARDFYIGSDLTLLEKKRFYRALKKENFFELLETFLYSDIFFVCSWTIYTIGKFSEPENAKLLEIAYETTYKGKNPLLAYRCLSELNWLESAKVEYYLAELEHTNTIAAKLIQLYYYSHRVGCDSKTNALLKNKEFRQLLAPNETAPDYTKNKKIIDKLFPFELYLTKLYNNSKNIYINNFDSIVKNYFDSIDV